jgi:hypothetical protein
MEIAEIEQSKPGAQASKIRFGNYVTFVFTNRQGFLLAVVKIIHIKNLGL